MGRMKRSLSAHLRGIRIPKADINAIALELCGEGELCSIFLDIIGIEVVHVVLLDHEINSSSSFLVKFHGCRALHVMCEWICGLVERVLVGYVPLFIRSIGVVDNATWSE